MQVDSPHSAPCYRADCEASLLASLSPSLLVILMEGIMPSLQGAWMDEPRQCSHSALLSEAFKDYALPSLSSPLMPNHTQREDLVSLKSLVNVRVFR